MIKLSKLSLIVISCVLMVSVASCSVTKKMYGLSEVEVPLVVSNQSVPQTFRNLDKSLRLNISSSVTDDVIYDDENLPAFLRKSLPHYTFVPGVKAFAEDATRSYMQRMQFDINYDGEYQLAIEVKTFGMTWLDKKTVECRVSLNYKLTNGAGETIIPMQTANSRITLAQAENFGIGLGRAYAAALNEINWSAIAKHLTVANRPSEEKNAQVTGAGDTALEHTIIRWYIISAPQGADVTWRVVSSTPDVPNTNSSYVGTTPYETTESFDIKGLTYNNSGNVQIEVTCKKNGYMPQRKRFNLRQVIDQKEISAKFNLVKDE